MRVESIHRNFKLYLSIPLPSDQIFCEHSLLFLLFDCSKCLYWIKLDHLKETGTGALRYSPCTGYCIVPVPDTVSDKTVSELLPA